MEIIRMEIGLGLLYVVTIVLMDHIRIFHHLQNRTLIAIASDNYQRSPAHIQERFDHVLGVTCQRIDTTRDALADIDPTIENYIEVIVGNTHHITDVSATLDYLMLTF